LVLKFGFYWLRTFSKVFSSGFLVVEKNVQAGNLIERNSKIGGNDL